MSGYNYSTMDGNLVEKIHEQDLGRSPMTGLALYSGESKTLYSQEASLPAVDTPSSSVTDCPAVHHQNVLALMHEHCRKQAQKIQVQFPALFSAIKGFKTENTPPVASEIDKNTPPFLPAANKNTQILDPTPVQKKIPQTNRADGLSPPSHKNPGGSLAAETPQINKRPVTPDPPLNTSGGVIMVADFEPAAMAADFFSALPNNMEEKNTPPEATEFLHPKSQNTISPILDGDSYYTSPPSFDETTASQVQLESFSVQTPPTNLVEAAITKKPTKKTCPKQPENPTPPSSVTSQAQDQHIHSVGGVRSHVNNKIKTPAVQDHPADTDAGDRSLEKGRGPQDPIENSKMAKKKISMDGDAKNPAVQVGFTPPAAKFTAMDNSKMDKIDLVQQPIPSPSHSPSPATVFGQINNANPWDPFLPFLQNLKNNTPKTAGSSETDRIHPDSVTLFNHTHNTPSPGTLPHRTRTLLTTPTGALSGVPGGDRTCQIFFVRSQNKHQNTLPHLQYHNPHFLEA